MPRKNTTAITGTIQAWSIALNLDPSTIKRKLTVAEIKFEAGSPISALHIFKALTEESEKDKAMTRKLNAEAQARERDNRKEDGELFELPAIERKLWTDLLQPLQQELNQMPNGLAGLCNPQEPEVPKKVLTQWVEKTKLIIKGKETK